VKWAVAACSLGLAGFAGCSCGGADDPDAPAGAARVVGATVERLEQAIARGDWDALCDDLFTDSARRRAGGKACARLVRSDAEGLRRPQIRVLRIDVEGRRAEVQVRSTARGQRRLTDVIVLRRERGAYRVDSLAR
jgi:hypothetical protein